MNKIRNAFFVYLIFLVASLLSQEEWKYKIDFTINPTEPIDYVNLSSLRFINPSNKKIETLNIFIRDTDNNLCEIKKLNKINANEAEVLFVPTKKYSYTAYITENTAKTVQTEKDLPDSQMLIDDFVSTKATKSGHWNWVSSPLVSGSVSLAGKKGTSFQRLIFPTPYKISKNDKLILYLYTLLENPPEEIMVELVTTRNRKYFFSWGKDFLDTDRANKISLGNLPEKSGWVKMEIPFTNVREVTLNGVGLYNFKGDIWWDRISINEVPLTTSIIDLKEKGKDIKAYFTYTLSPLFKIGDNIFELLKLNALPASNSEEISFMVGDKIYKEKSLELLLTKEDNRNISLKTEKNGVTDTMSYLIPKSRNKPKEVEIITKILPYQPFIKDGDPFNIVVSLRNLNEEIIPIEVRNKNFKGKTQLKPEETKHIYLEFSNYQPGDILEADIYIYNLKLCEKKFKVVTTENQNIKINGPFMEDNEGSFLLIDLTPNKDKKNLISKDFLNITIAGSYPQKTTEALKTLMEEKSIECDIKEIGKPEYRHNHRLFAEYLHIIKNINNSEKGDIFVFMPYIESMKHKTDSLSWSRCVEAIITAAENKFDKIILLSPFPSPPFPEIYEVYRNTAEDIAHRRRIGFLDIYNLYLLKNDYRKDFQHTEGIYKNLPKEEEISLFVNKLFDILIKPTEIYQP